MSAESHATTFAPPVLPDGRTGLVGLDRQGLEAVLGTLDLPPFRARQVWHWLYHRGVTSFDEMTTLAKPVRTLLAEKFSIERPVVTRDQASVDGTRKWLIKMNDGQEVETVHIPESDRGALCVSSQVGCTLTCRFCHTGTQPLVRNLGPDEILTQVMTARDALGEWPAVGTNPNNETSTLTNIVMMGMGEPLYNYDNAGRSVARAADRSLPECWLLAEWPPGQAEPTDYWLSTLPADVGLRHHVRLAKMRWRFEHDFRVLWVGLGVEQFEGRSWSGWHSHVTLTCMAQAL